MGRLDKEYDTISFGMRSQMLFELSPFYFCTFEIGGKKWRTLIHYWWEHKMVDTLEDSLAASFKMWILAVQGSVTRIPALFEGRLFNSFNRKLHFCV